MTVTACPLDCPDTCAIDVTVQDGRITRIDAAPGNPMTDGWICAKVRKHAQRVHGPDRVLTPLIRTGPKGSGQFRPGTWDEAIELTATAVERAMERHGPGSVVPYTYNSSVGKLADVLSDRLWGRLGAAKVHHTICAATASQAYADVYGDMYCADPRDVVHSRMVVVWGANPVASHSHWAPLVQQAVKAGAELVVVDPRRTSFASRATTHLAVRPGTDVVLALAMACHLHEEGLLDVGFLDAHVDGVEEYLANAEPFTLARAEAECGVPAADIATFAERYATTRPSYLRMGWGLERNRNGGSGCRAVLALPLLCGHFGVLGSGVLTSTGKGAPVTMAAAEPAGAPPALARRDVNMNHLGALLCGEHADEAPVSVLVVMGANPAVMNPEQTKVLRGLERDDLFTVVHEQVLTDTAAYADVVLPATTHFEHDDVRASYGSYAFARIVAVIDRVGESRTNNEFIAALAVRLGQPAADFDADASRLLDRVVAPGHEAGGARELRAAGATVGFRDVFPTHDGQRARLHDVEGELPLPQYRAVSSDHPLTLVSPATSRTINSIFGEFNSLPAALHMAPADAAARGLADGERVRVFNDHAALELPIRLDAELRDGVCLIPKGLWRRSVDGGLTANALCPDTLSDLAGGACFNDARVSVVRSTTADA